MKKRTIEISEETYELIKDQLKEEEKIEINSLDDFIGKAFFFRTVTYHIIGKVERVLSHGLLELSQATWVADSGRFMNCIKDGEINEAEPIGQHWININSCTDIAPWKHSLKIEQK